jgi:hypothetical protein
MSLWRSLAIASVVLVCHIPAVMVGWQDNHQTHQYRRAHVNSCGVFTVIATEGVPQQTRTRLPEMGMADKERFVVLQADCDHRVPSMGRACA